MKPFPTRRRSPVGGSADGIGLVQRVGFEDNPSLSLFVRWKDLERRAAALQHRKPRSLPDPADNLRQRGSKLLGINDGRS